MSKNPMRRLRTVTDLIRSPEKRAEHQQQFDEESSRVLQYMDDNDDTLPHPSQSGIVNVGEAFNRARHDT